MRAKQIYEVFTQDSDPISDMNIGILDTKHDFKSIEESYKFFIEYCIASILKKEKIPSDILKQNGTFINEKYYYKLDAWFNKHITINGYSKNFNPIDLGYKLYRKKFKVECPYALTFYRYRDTEKHVKHIKQK